MNKRKFDLFRLYKLTAFLVIVTTIFFVFKWYNDETIFNSLKPSYEKVCLPAQPIPTETYNSICIPLDKAGIRANDESRVAIFLPLIFFGGTLVYLFIFPKRKGKDKPQN